MHCSTPDICNCDYFCPAGILIIKSFKLKGTWGDTSDYECKYCSDSLTHCAKCDSATNCTECEATYNFIGTPGSFTCIDSYPLVSNLIYNKFLS